MRIYSVVAIVSFVVFTGCGQSSQQAGNNASATTSPWHSLTETEINEAAAAVNDAFGEGILFNLSLIHI